MRLLNRSFGGAALQKPASNNSTIDGCHRSTARLNMALPLHTARLSFTTYFPNRGNKEFMTVYSLRVNVFDTLKLSPARSKGAGLLTLIFALGQPIPGRRNGARGLL